MPVEGFLDTRGKKWLAVGLCDRCKRKFTLEELWSDRNNPALKVCRDELDEYDPYRLPARTGERIALRFPRPDEALS